MAHRTFADPNSIEARQHLLDNRCEHGPKRHRTKKRKSRHIAAKRVKGVRVQALSAVERMRRLTLMREFWQGERDAHP